MTFGGRRLLMEDKLWWKKILMEDALWWKTTFDGRKPLMEDDLWWKTTFDGSRPLMEDNLWWKTSFDRRWPMIKDDLWWEIYFNFFQTKISFRLNIFFAPKFFPGQRIFRPIFFLETKRLIKTTSKWPNQHTNYFMHSLVQGNQLTKVLKHALKYYSAVLPFKLDGMQFQFY